MALAYGDRRVSLSQMAASQRLSRKYLAQIMNALRAGELVNSARGSAGGYELARAPEDIALSDVYAVLEGPLGLPECVGHPDRCQMAEACPTRDTWAEIGAAVGTVLAGTTLQDLADRARSRMHTASSTERMYYI